MQERDYALNHSQVEQQEVSSVLRNTYGLLAITLAFSGLVAFISQRANVPYPNIFVVLIGFYGLFFLTAKLRNSAWGLLSHPRADRLHGLHPWPDPQPLPGHDQRR